MAHSHPPSTHPESAAGQAHSHPHDHGHSHAPSGQHASIGAPAALCPGAGRGKVLFFDAPSGLSGDMIVSALLDLGIPLEVLERTMAQLPVQGFKLQRGVRYRSGIACASFEVQVDPDQPERTWASIDQMLETAALEPRATDLARRIFRVLGEAEAHVHRVPLESVHFHEVGAVDSIVDIAGAAAMLCWLDPTEIVCSPLPLGHGTIRARHGVLPLPAPATLHCLQGIPTFGLDLEAELVTPTGAAMVRAAAHRFARWPAMTPEHIGMGSGARELPERPNLLRVVLGTPAPDRTGEHALVEANLDDMTGELAGHVIDRLMLEGALDVWVTATTTKKGRPGMTLSALCDEARLDQLWQAMLRETTTIGVRVQRVSRFTRPRRMVEVATAFGPIPVKVSEGGYGPAQAKPEFDACVAAADQAGVPVREVIGAAVAAWRATR